MSLATYLLEPKYKNMAIKNPQNHFILTFRIFNLKFWQIFTNKKRVGGYLWKAMVGLENGVLG
jgi:hypothetical protein